MNESIDKLVDNVVAWYIREDFNHLVETARRGEKVHGTDTIDEMIRFLLNNELADISNAREVAELSLARINEINEDIYKKYGVSY